jgi:hypothetical protein
LDEYRNADIGYMEAAALAMLGRADEAIALLRARGDAPTVAAPFVASLRATLEQNRAEAMALITQALTHSVARDGEAVFYMARQCAYLGENDRALHFLQLAVRQGFVCYPRLLRDPWLDPLRDLTAFKGLLRAAETRHKQALETFAAAQGTRLLGGVSA